MNEVFGADQKLEGVQMGKSPVIGFSPHAWGWSVSAIAFFVP